MLSGEGNTEASVSQLMMARSVIQGQADVHCSGAQDGYLVIMVHCRICNVTLYTLKTNSTLSFHSSLKSVFRDNYLLIFLLKDQSEIIQLKV